MLRAIRIRPGRPVRALRGHPWAFLGEVEFVGEPPVDGDCVELTDLKGRTVTLADTPDRVLLGFYYEDFIAITGPGGIDKVVAISRAPWAEWRPMQWEAYKAVYPQIDTLPDVGDTETSTFSVEAAIAAKPDVALLAGSSMRLARVWRSLNPQASRLSWSITTPRRWSAMSRPPCCSVK